ncbi:MAG: hypothetical protein B6D68_01520 [spirochete symbiont of Stewartia floridana]|nr:MAG: hypothetical protein B6D68_01520 [spirochete symbiont of Stewartia floridana]
MRLWRRIFHDKSPYAHISQVLSAIAETNEPYTGEDSRLILFGSTFLGETGLGFFKKLSRFLDVHHFVLSPYAGTGSPTQPFLISNARLSSGFNALIPKLRPDSQEGHWVNSGYPDTTLHRLRASLINDEEFAGPLLDDGSLCFHDSPGIRRCVEILKDAILAALRDDETLAPTQIGVLAPDIGLYAPYIETIFPALGGQDIPRTDHLPYNITDLPHRDEAPYPSALGALLDLPGARFGCNELLRLVTNPCFSPAAADPSLAEQWKNLIDISNIRWGVDSRHREEAGAADHITGSWKQAFERVIAGYYYDEGDNPEILPLPDVSDTKAEDAGKLMQVIMGLNSQIRPLHKQSMMLKEWTALWESIIGTWLRARLEDENDRIRIKEALRNLNALSADVNDLSDFADARIPWPVFRSLLDEFRSNAGNRRGRYLARGITCGSLKPTRAIPFRRIYVLGLDESAWPGRDSPVGFDLRERIPRAIDLSRESIDRFTILEVLYSAADHLSLFYTGRDLERGEVLAPSASILELLDYLGEGSECLIRRHRFLPYDSAALTGEGPLATCSTEALALAEARNRRSNPVEILPLPLPEEEESTDWMSLVAFLRNPIRFFYRQRLGAELDIGQESPDDNDILESQPLRWWRYRDETVRGAISALARPDEFVRVFQRISQLESAVSQTPVAEIQAGQWREESRALQLQLQRIIREGYCPEESFTCRLMELDAEHHGAVAPSAEGFIDIGAPRVALDDGSHLGIQGSIDGLGFLRVEGESNRQVWTLVDFVSRRTPGAAHNIRGWMAALVLAAALENPPREIRVFRVGQQDYKARRYYFREDDIPEGSGGEKKLLSQPHRLLQRLGAVYRRGKRLPLPLYPELADELHRAIKDTGIEDFSASFAAAWNKVISNSQAPFSAMRDCPWRRRFLSSTASLEDQARQALVDLYMEGGIL